MNRLIEVTRRALIRSRAVAISSNVARGVDDDDDDDSARVASRA
jgi:hypothetical protein